MSAGALAVAVSEPGSARAIAQRGHDERLRQAIIDVLGADLSIDILHDPDASKASGRRVEAPATGPTTAGSAAASAGAASGGSPSGGSASGPGPSGGAGTSSLDGRSPENPDATGAQPTRPPAPARAGPGAGAAVVRAASSSGPVTAAVDEPSADDPDLDGAAVNGLALITRELGARPIGEIDHS